MMPGVDGHRSTRRCATTRRPAGIAVVFLTGRSAPSEAARYVAEGVDYLTKPFDPADLVALVRRRTEGAGRDRGAPRRDGCPRAWSAAAPGTRHQLRTATCPSPGAAGAQAEGSRRLRHERRTLARGATREDRRARSRRRSSTRSRRRRGSRPSRSPGRASSTYSSPTIGSTRRSGRSPREGAGYGQRRTHRRARPGGVREREPHRAAARSDMRGTP